MEDAVVLYDDLPKTHQLVRLVVLLVDRLQRPVYPRGRRSRAGVPVWDQNVEGLLDESADLVVALGKGLQAADESEV